MKRDKKAISPVIATVLLIMIVIILAIIIFLWAKYFIGEAIIKNDAPADQRCDEVDLVANYVGSELQITNRGSVSIYRLEIRAVSGGSKDITSEEGLNIGESSNIDVGGGYDRVEIVPVILGETQKGKKHKAFTCKNNIILAE